MGILFFIKIIRLLDGSLLCNASNNEYKNDNNFSYYLLMSSYKIYYLLINNHHRFQHLNELFHRF